jgi:hypothetical protein
MTRAILIAVLIAAGVLVFWLTSDLDDIVDNLVLWAIGILLGFLIGQTEEKR